MSIDILVSTTCGVLLASSGWKRGMLLNILQRPGQKLLVQMLSALWLETLLQGQFYSPPFPTREIEALSSEVVYPKSPAGTG